MFRNRFSPAFQVLTFSTLLIILLGGVAFYLPHLEARTTSPLPLLRLHVIAPSDDPADQALKLKVRDEILAYVDPLLADCHSVEESREVVLQHLDEIQKKAEERVQQEGYNYSVAPQVGRFQFPKKVYGHLVAPAGEYEALRVVIGEGKGANWWCVLYPPLCLSDRTGAQVTVPAATVENSTVNEGQPEMANVEIRSKLWDWIQEKTQ
ncbi:stage II sporulation protein R [Heliobacterium mobile]|uniref:stage II sporulation protein R n=1 Tax=Heliobacterium mobile TaxID=28064 RepID=UPI001478F3D8|nr:stage II sporulation protein R [Heliobacterium mobile]